MIKAINTFLYEERGFKGSWGTDRDLYSPELLCINKVLANKTGESGRKQEVRTALLLNAVFCLFCIWSSLFSEHGLVEGPSEVVARDWYRQTMESMVGRLSALNEPLLNSICAELLK
jgi:hypothetical protein